MAVKLKIKMIIQVGETFFRISGYQYVLIQNRCLTGYRFDSHIFLNDH